ncbi:MAG: DUF3883 domain-containing protein, partial [Acidimicrobiia bacterium]|nr:DUF3883 domain-containing protein [Acidimicrobiia bacterium]
FMAHPLCWGSLTPQERTDALGDDLWVWGALFDISEFRFEEVVRKAVLPALLLDPDADAAALLDALQSLDSIAAICQLAGNTPKPERPLRYERLGSDRGLFNLSRLPLPCRDNDGVSWVPAYRVYFGKDWIGDESVEDLFTAAGPLEANYLLAPSEFLGRLPGFGAEDRDDVTADDVSNVDDEVDIDEDTDRAVEGTEQERWISFLEWIGVNRAIRPIHFHDVEDRDAGWLTTKELAQPKGWAFKGLEETWGGYRRVLTEWIANTDAGGVIPYVYRAHDLDQIVPVLEAARRDATGETAKRFFTHLAQHWDLLDDFAHVELALVESRFQPSMRTRPVRAKAEELTHACEDFWLFRLRESSVCPTTHGPRAPAQTFAPSPEAQRRFGGRGRRAGDYIPLLELDDPVTTDNALPLARRLGVRTDLNPSTFTIDDAKVVCERIRLHLESQDSISESDLRERVRPVYRQVFELLSGSEADSTAPPLVSTPLLALTPNGYSFLPASEIFYSRTPGLAQRSGVLGSVPTFVIDADSSATSPLTRIFGVQQLETALQWSADPSEPPFDSDHLPEFREALRRLAPFLLARVLVERSNPQDVSRLKAFVDSVMPAEFLDVSGEIAGQTLDQADSRPYFVGSGDGEEPTTAFVQWDGPAWPPTPESAQALAMALADVLGINLVEGFLGLIRAEGDERLRLLDLAGARAYLPEAREALEDTNLGESPPTIAPGDPAITKTPAAEPSGWSTEAPPEFERPPAPPHVPLRKFSDLLIGGEPLLILGPGTGDHSPRSGQDTAKQADRGEGPSSAPGVDINALDALGMRIAIAYEVNRLSSGGLTTHAITADTDLTASSSRCLVVDVSTPDAVRHAEANPHVSRVLAELAQFGIGTTHPGFDILTIREGFYERLIELKSSAVNAQVQQMTWNEWKSAGTSRVRQHFWLYLVGNLRADLSNAPFVRAIRDPFGVLASRTVSEATTRTAVQLRVREFESAEELQLEVRGEGEVRRE